jgi:hypothetical protein
MGFPTSLDSKFEIQLPDSTVGLAAVLDYLERAFASYDADITSRGEHFFEFRVSSTSRLVRELRPPLTPRPWTPLSFVGSGVLTLTQEHGRVIVATEVHTSRFLVLWSAVVLLLSGAFAPFTSLTGRFLIGALLGLALGAASYALAAWEFGSWFQRLGGELANVVASGRLTSA